MAIIREIKEEINAEVINCVPIAITKYHFLESNKIEYQLTYKSKIKLLSGSINDPDGDTKDRQIIKFTDLVKTFENSSHVKALTGLIL